TPIFSSSSAATPTNVAVLHLEHSRRGGPLFTLGSGVPHFAHASITTFLRICCGFANALHAAPLAIPWGSFYRPDPPARQTISRDVVTFLPPWSRVHRCRSGRQARR